MVIASSGILNLWIFMLSHNQSINLSPVINYRLIADKVIGFNLSVIFAPQG